MKDRKSLLFILPVLVFLGTFLIARTIDNKSYAIQSGPRTDVYSDTAEATAIIKDGTDYKMLRKNTYSWHLISHNFNSFSSTNASGTKLLETTSEIDGYKYKAVAYCATEGKTLSSGSNRKRYALDSSKVTTLNDDKKQKISAVMPYMYPYISLGVNSSSVSPTGVDTLKKVLKSNNKGLDGSKYTDYEFDNLNVNEAITAAQAAIWNIQKGKTDYYNYRGTISSFSAFSSCNSYYSGKMNTSEEVEWYNATKAETGDGCNSNGNFYKYVYKHNKDNNTQNRINTLIDWYVNKLKGKLDAIGNSQSQYFKVTSSSFTVTGLELTFDTNISSYDIIITDESRASGQQEIKRIQNTSSRNLTITDLPSDVKQVNIEIVSRESETKPHVFYYIASSGQDFIGLEKTFYTKKENITIRREEELGKIIVYKVGNTNKNVEVSDNGSTNFDATKCNSTIDKCLSGAKFELYYENKNNLIRRFETDYDVEGTPTSVIFDNLPLGKYYLKETQPAYGYDLYKYNIGTSGTDGYVDSDGYITIILTGNNQGTQTKAVVVNNNYNKICVSKVSVNNPNLILDGATFEISDIDGNVLTEFDTSSLEGAKCFEGLLQSGSYFLQEKKAPVGFSLDPNRYHFVVGNADSDISSLDDIGTYKNVTVSNNTITLKNKEGLQMSKSDLTDGACVTGALLIIKNSSGNEVTRWTSTCSSNDEEGEDSHTVPICLTTEEQQSFGDTACLRPGKYTLTEEIHPEGYATAETINFEIASDGKVIGDTNMKDAPIEVCIYKVKKDTKEVLIGAEFEIYKKRSNNVCVATGDSNCTSDSSTYSDDDLELYTKFTSSEEPCIPYFPVGEYVVRETKAPEGYELPENNETVITVEDKAGHQDFYIENEVIVPKTAMDYSVTVVIIASVFMMFGIGLVGYYEYKKGH